MYNAREMSDKMKKCKVQMSRCSLQQKGINEIYSYIADLAENENSLALRYDDEKSNHFMVVYKEGVLKLKCEGETKSNLELIKDTWTEVNLQTAFGNMVLRSKAKKIIHSKDCLVVCYELYQDKEFVDEITLQWKLLRNSLS